MDEKDLEPEAATQAADDATEIIGETFAHYRVVNRLGGGGMGVVYTAEDVRHQSGRGVEVSSGAVSPRTNGRTPDRQAVWAPGGSLVYFLSERDGFRCFWAQRLDPATKRPLGEPFVVQHFHEARRSFDPDRFAGIQLSMGPDKLVHQNFMFDLDSHGAECRCGCDGRTKQLPLPLIE